MNILRIVSPWYPWSWNSTPYQPVYWRVLNAVLAGCKGLNLAGFDPSNIVIQKEPWARDWTNDVRQFPGLVVCTWGSEGAAATAGTNLRDDIDYPVLVSIFDRNNEDNSTNNMKKYLRWREQVSRHFRYRPLKAVPEIIKAPVTPLPVVLPDAYVSGVLHTAMVFRFTSREVRGDDLLPT